MSYDLRIFFPQPEFPRSEWLTIMNYFEFEEIAENDWCKVTEFADNISSLFVGVTQTNPQESTLCQPIGTYWIASITTSTGRTPHAVWLQFAIPYHTLSFIPNVTVHDCQWHNDENLYSFTNAVEWWEFSAKAMPKMIRKRQLIKLGYLTESGKPIF